MLKLYTALNWHLSLLHSSYEISVLLYLVQNLFCLSCLLELALIYTQKTLLSMYTSQAANWDFFNPNRGSDQPNLAATADNLRCHGNIDVR